MIHGLPLKGHIMNLKVYTQPVDKFDCRNVHTCIDKETVVSIVFEQFHIRNGIHNNMVEHQ